MSAADHLSGEQFFHSSNADFKPGDVLTRESAWRAKTGAASPKTLSRFDTDPRPMSEKGPQYAFGGPVNHEGHPATEHLHYGNHDFVSNGDSADYGRHTYAVAPESGAAHEPDPMYPAEAGAFRTSGRLRVLRKVSSGGNGNWGI